MTASLSLDPAPASPTHIVRAPTQSKIGCTGSRSSSGPEASTTSLPCSAGALVPSTGASTNAIPRSSASATQRSVPSMPIVLICSQIASPPCPADSAPASPFIASITASVSATMVRMTSAPSAACAGVSKISAPSPASGSAFSRERFQARIG